MNDQPPPGSRSRSRAVYPTNYDVTVPPSPQAPHRGESGRRRSTLQALPLALGAFVGIGLAILAVMLLSHQTSAISTPPVDQTARQLCNDLTTQRYDDLYGLLSTAEQEVGPRDQFVASQRQLDAQLGTVGSCSYTSKSQNTTSATLSLQLSRSTAPAAAAQVQLVLQGSNWRIADYDSSAV